MITTHTHRPTPVSAVQWTGQNLAAVRTWAAPSAVRPGAPFPPYGPVLYANDPGADTGEPSVTVCAVPGDWLYRCNDGTDSTLRVADRDTFARLYRPVNP